MQKNAICCGCEQRTEWEREFFPFLRFFSLKCLKMPIGCFVDILFCQYSKNFLFFPPRFRLRIITTSNTRTLYFFPVKVLAVKRSLSFLLFARRFAFRHCGGETLKQEFLYKTHFSCFITVQQRHVC